MFAVGVSDYIVVLVLVVKQLLVSLSCQLLTEGVTKSPISWGVVHGKNSLKYLSPLQST